MIKWTWCQRHVGINNIQYLLLHTVSCSYLQYYCYSIRNICMVIWALQALLIWLWAGPFEEFGGGKKIKLLFGDLEPIIWLKWYFCHWFVSVWIYYCTSVHVHRSFNMHAGYTGIESHSPGIVMAMMRSRAVKEEVFVQVLIKSSLLNPCLWLICRSTILSIGSPLFVHASFTGFSDRSASVSSLSC